jgi:hypothetical protein
MAQVGPHEDPPLVASDKVIEESAKLIGKPFVSQRNMEDLES